MFTEPTQEDLSTAISDFHRARNRGQLKALFSRLTGASDRLLSYDDVRQMLRLQGGIERGVQDIPLDAIVGSVGRYSDFTRDFLPLHEATQERWVRVKAAASGLAGLPPIEVYKIGNAYFVKDGNHRVSVARQLGAHHIQAYVTEVQSRVPLDPNVKPDDLILISEYNQFLERTHLDQLRPDADLRVTAPGQYPVLLEHIDVHRYYMGLDFQRDISYEEAVTHWYDTVYLPIVEFIRQQGILRRFPDRTETDLYLWIAEHRAELEEELGHPVRPEHVAGHLVEEHSQALENFLGRLGNRLLEIIAPDKLESGPRAGQWRSRALAGRSDNRLFLDLLTPLNGKEDGWCALEQAIVVARREGSNIYGLHVRRDEDEDDSEMQAIRAEFDRRCENSGVNGRMVFSTGEIVEETCSHAAVTDLVIVNLSYPPAAQPLARLASGFHDLIQRCPRPVLATPQTVSPLNRALLAFDGSPKAREALFLATYLAGQWHIPLDVITVSEDDRSGQETLENARQYLEEHNVKAGYHLKTGVVSQALLELAQELNSDLIVMGGYGLSPVLEVVLGSTVNDVLRESEKPILICR
jgi:nucleotide-binding universal stress UspA family protein